MLDPGGVRRGLYRRDSLASSTILPPATETTACTPGLQHLKPLVIDCARPIHKPAQAAQYSTQLTSGSTVYGCPYIHFVYPVDEGIQLIQAVQCVKLYTYASSTYSRPRDRVYSGSTTGTVTFHTCTLHTQ